MLENFNALQLNHGLMEVGYIKHRTILDSEQLDHGQALSVSMGATMDTLGNLTLGKIFSRSCLHSPMLLFFLSFKVQGLFS